MATVRTLNHSASLTGSFSVIFDFELWKYLKLEAKNNQWDSNIKESFDDVHFITVTLNQYQPDKNIQISLFEQHNGSEFP